jgi:hypothetical protein
MSAAATAAGYLYASGRLRGKNQREQDAEHPESSEQPRAAKPRMERPRIEKPVRVAAVPAREDLRERGQEQSTPRRTPTIQYRTRRWKPEQHGE